jgi:hypothetical protein
MDLNARANDLLHQFVLLFHLGVLGVLGGYTSIASSGCLTGEEWWGSLRSTHPTRLSVSSVFSVAILLPRRQAA